MASGNSIMTSQVESPQLSFFEPLVAVPSTTGWMVEGQGVVALAC